MRLAAARVKLQRTSHARVGFAMSRRMPSERAFRVLREQSDRVSLRQIASIALACAGLGLGLSSVAQHYIHARPKHGGQDVSVTGPLAHAAVTWPFLVGEPVPHTPSERAAPADPAGPAPMQTARRPLRLTREKVTYLRCQHGRAGSACKRDHALEKQVWRALRDVAACYGAAAPGHAELRLELRRDHAPEIALLPPAQGPSLNLRAVRGCVEAPLRKRPDRLSTAPMSVRFRFGLR